MTATCPHAFDSNRITDIAPHSVRGKSLSLRRLVEALAHFLAGLEVGQVLFSHRDNSTILRITPFPSRALSHREHSEAAQFYAIASDHRRNNFFDHSIDDRLDDIGVRSVPKCAR
jgi:hypothetical protein